MGRMLALTPTMAKEVKDRIWNGEKQEDISAEIGVSRPVISHIKTGRAYHDINWPDGSNGGMPEYRRLQLMKGRQRDTKTAIRLGASNTNDDLAFLNKLAIDSGYKSWAAVVEMRAEQRAKEEAEKIDRMVEAVRLRHGDEDPSPAPSRPLGDPYNSPINPDVNDKHEWDYIMQRANRINIVAVADAEDNQPLKLSIQILFKQLPPSMWNEVPTLGLIMRLSERIKAWFDQQAPALPANVVKMPLPAR